MQALVDEVEVAACLLKSGLSELGSRAIGEPTSGRTTLQRAGHPAAFTGPKQARFVYDHQKNTFEPSSGLLPEK